MADFDDDELREARTGATAAIDQIVAAALGDVATVNLIADAVLAFEKAVDALGAVGVPRKTAVGVLTAATLAHVWPEV